MGKRHYSSFSPVRLAFCFAPSAACSCFSTSVTFFFNSYTSFVGASVGWVSFVLSYNTMSSTSHKRSTYLSILSWISSSLFNTSGVATIYFALVVLWWPSVVVLFLSSLAKIYIFSSSTTLSNYTILYWLDSFILVCSFRPSLSLWISCSFAQFYFAHSVRTFNCAASSSSTWALMSSTLFANWFPAYWTVPMEDSASFFPSIQFNSI